MERLAVVLVNWNGGSRLERCLDHLGAGSRGPDDVIVVDNASTDGSCERLIGERRCSLIRNQENRGFAAAANQGIESALARGADWVLLLNDDAVVRRDTVELLLEAARRHPEAGLLAPKILYPDETTIWSAGLEIGFHPNVQRLRGHGRPDDGRFDGDGEVDALTGCCLLMRRETIESAGYLDERFFVYVEDLDYSLRVRRAGMTCRLVPAAVVLHDAGASTGGGVAPRRKYLVAYHVVQFLRKYRRIRWWLAFWFCDVMLWPLAYASAVPRGEGAAMLAKARGIADALLGRACRRP